VDKTWTGAAKDSFDSAMKQMESILATVRKADKAAKSDIADHYEPIMTIHNFVGYESGAAIIADGVARALYGSYGPEVSFGWQISVVGQMLCTMAHFMDHAKLDAGRLAKKLNAHGDDYHSASQNAQTLASSLGIQV